MAGRATDRGLRVLFVVVMVVALAGCLAVNVFDVSAGMASLPLVP